MIDTTEDTFLGGSLSLLQPKRGYRAGADPVLLAASVEARAGQSVLELGCGVGVALLCLMRRTPGLVSVGVERQSDLVDMARANAAANALDARIFEADLAFMPTEIRAMSFDHVIANPPFFERDRGTAARDATREAGRREDTPLDVWIDTAVRRLKPGGTLHIVQRAARLADILRAMDARLGGLRILPLAARNARAADNVIVTAKKGGRGALVLDTPFVLHDGDHHDADRDSYSRRAQAVLRGGLGLSDAKLMPK